jgi:hypothetical protein
LSQLAPALKKHTVEFTLHTKDCTLYISYGYTLAILRFNFLTAPSFILYFIFSYMHSNSFQHARAHMSVAEWRNDYVTCEAPPLAITYSQFSFRKTLYEHSPYLGLYNVYPHVWLTYVCEYRILVSLILIPRASIIPSTGQYPLFVRSAGDWAKSFFILRRELWWKARTRRWWLHKPLPGGSDIDICSSEGGVGERKLLAQRWGSARCHWTCCLEMLESIAGAIYRKHGRPIYSHDNIIFRNRLRSGDVRWMSRDLGLLAKRATNVTSP